MEEDASNYEWSMKERRERLKSVQKFIFFKLELI